MAPIPYLTTPPRWSNFDALEWWFPLPDGRVLATRSDRLGFLLRWGPDHRTLFLADVAAQGPLRLPDERQALQAAADFAREQAALRGDDKRPHVVVPERKLVLVRSDAMLSVDGVIWMWRSGVSVKGEPHGASATRMPNGTIKYAPSTSYSEPLIYSGFRLDGTYLGDVRFPKGVSGVSFVAGNAWAGLPRTRTTHRTW